MSQRIPFGLAPPFKPRNTLNESSTSRSHGSRNTYSHRPTRRSKPDPWTTMSADPLRTRHDYGFQVKEADESDERPNKRTKISHSSPIRALQARSKWDVTDNLDSEPFPADSRRAGASADPSARRFLQSHASERVSSGLDLEESPISVRVRSERWGDSKSPAKDPVPRHARRTSVDMPRWTSHDPSRKSLLTRPESPLGRDKSPELLSIVTYPTAAFDHARSKEDLRGVFRQSHKRPTHTKFVDPADQVEEERQQLSKPSAESDQAPLNAWFAAKSGKHKTNTVRQEEDLTKSPFFSSSSRGSQRLRDRMQDSVLASNAKRLAPRASEDELSGPINVSSSLRNNQQKPARSHLSGSSYAIGKKRSKVEAFENRDHISDSEPETPVEVDKLLGEFKACTKAKKGSLRRINDPTASTTRPKSPPIVIPDDETQEESKLASASPSSTIPNDSSLTNPRLPARPERFDNVHDRHPIAVTSVTAGVPSPESPSQQNENEQKEATCSKRSSNQDDTAAPANKADTEDGIPKQWLEPLTWPFEGPKKVSVNYEDVFRLNEEEYLNDSIVNFCLRHLEVHNQETSSAIYFFNTYFYDALTRLPNGKAGFNYDAVKSWTRKVDLFAYDSVIIPVNRNFHWYLFIVSNLPALVAGDDVQDVTADFEKAAAMPDELQHQSDHVDNGSQVSVKEVEVSDLRLEQMSLSRPATEKDVLIASPVESLSQGVFKVETDDDKRAQRRLSRQVRTQQKGIFKSTEPIVIALDSMGGEHTTEIRHIKRYFVEEALQRRGCELRPRDINSTTAKGVPTQANAWDCGIFLIGYVAEFLKHPREFIEKVCSREMDETNSFRNFDASQQRKNIRRILVSLEKDQKRLRIRAKKQKAALQATGDADGEKKDQAKSRFDTEEASSRSASPSKPTLPQEESVVVEVAASQPNDTADKAKSKSAGAAVVDIEDQEPTEQAPASSASPFFSLLGGIEEYAVG